MAGVPSDAPPVKPLFFATGCVSEWNTDENGAFISVHDTFNSPEGLIAVKGIKKLVDSPYHLGSSSGTEFASCTGSRASSARSRLP